MSAIGRLLLNWGVLVLAVAVVLLVRYNAEVRARAPLPIPAVHLAAADARQWRAFPSFRGTVPVLTYHGINDSNDGLSVRPQAFAGQLLALKTAGFHPITLSQYVSFVHGDRRGLPSRPILLTFDDGRLDTYRAADRILRKYRFPATMFTFAAWPTMNPGFDLTWDELRRMVQSGIWSVQEHGGHGHEYVVINASGGEGGVYAFRQYIASRTGQGGHLESFPSFRRRVKSSILWGAHQFATRIPGFRPLAFAVPEGNYGQQQTNDRRIPRFMLPWLKSHFPVVFGGDYLTGHTDVRFSPEVTYRITMGSRVSLRAMHCRLRDWATRAPIWKEYRCLRPASVRQHFGRHRDDGLAKGPRA